MKEDTVLFQHIRDCLQLFVKCSAKQSLAFRLVCWSLVAAFGGGCIQASYDPARVFRIEANDNNGVAVGPIVFVRLTQRESLHGVEDPPKEHWLPEHITHIAELDARRNVFSEPRTQSGVQGIIFGPFLGLGRLSTVHYRVYAKGFSVRRERTKQMPAAWSREGQEERVKFTLVRLVSDSRSEKEKDVPPTSKPGEESKQDAVYSWDPTLNEWGKNQNGRSTFFRREYKLLTQDLSDDNFWRQIEERWRSGIDLPAIRLMCDSIRLIADEIDKALGMQAWPRDAVQRLTWVRRIAKLPE